MSVRILAATAAVIVIGCGGGGGDPQGPAGPTLTSIVITPTTTALFSKAPGNTMPISVVPRDQNGVTMAASGTKTYASDNTGVATVDAAGTISAVAGGTAHIAVSMTIGSNTRTGTVTVNVTDAPATATVTAPALLFLPDAVHVSAGGTVTWSVGSIHHNISFTTGGAPANIPELLDSSASRTFATPGSYSYVCGFHSGMSGVVHVH